MATATHVPAVSGQGSPALHFQLHVHPFSCSPLLDAGCVIQQVTRSFKSDDNRQSLREGFFFLIEKYHVAFRLFFIRFCITFLFHFFLFLLYPSLTYSSLLRRRPFIVYFLLILFAFSFRSFDSEKRDIFCLSIVCL